MIATRRHEIFTGDRTSVSRILRNIGKNVFTNIIKYNISNRDHIVYIYVYIYISVYILTYIYIHPA